MIKAVINAMNVKGYAVFENDSKDLNLNYVGIRDLSNIGEINDTLFLFWKYRGKWNQLAHPGTTDPGKYYEQHLLDSDGVAILKEMQFRGAWTCGMHQGKYPALVQRKPVTVIRDGDKDGKLETVGKKEETGFFGINHHRMHSEAEVKTVGRYSAGCQVRQLAHQHDIFMSIAEESEDIWAKGITYGIIDIKDVKI